MPKGISVPVTQSGLETSINQAVKNVGPLNIPATIDPSAFKNLAQPLGRVSGLATEFEKSIAASNARVLAFGASVGIINGVQNAFADLLKTGIEVQKTLADIAAISGKSGQELSKFGDDLFNIGKTTGQTFKTAAQAALEFSRQGLSVEDTLKRTTDALTLTRFTSLNAAEAVDVLTAAANSFADSGITTAQIINKLVAVDTKFAVSAEDLANGLARAGSIAQEVGVNFDELNAAITVAQERTARGGAVIGNALKTIFTRLRSDETVEALRAIGVETLNAQGGLKGAVPLLQEVAQKIQGLSGGERVQILEAVASKYNINILSALLDDLNNANSKFTQAVGVSAGANNQAYERQIELNKTLSAEINRATVSVSQLLNKLAEIGVTDSLANLLKFVNNLIDGFNKFLDSESAGGNIAKGLIKGISDVFFTVGLPIIGAIFIKLTTDIAKFGIESLKTILGINQQVRERQALEQAVVNTLIRDQEIMATILALSGNRAKQEEYLLGVYNRQLAALQQVQNIASSVAPALIAGGLSATTGQIRKRAAGGYLPSQEASDVRRGIGGASPSSKVVAIPNFAFGGGKRGTMFANTSEYIVPNFANGGSAIFNKDMAKAYGLPAGAKKISAAGGYIPNFADKYTIRQGAQSFAGILRLPEEWTSSGGSNRPRDQARAALSEINTVRKNSGQSELTFEDLYTSQKLQSKKDIVKNASQYAEASGVAMLLPNVSEGAAANARGQAGVVPSLKNQKIAPYVKFKAFGLTTASSSKQKQVPNIEESISNAITGEAFNIVRQFDPITGKQPFDPSGFKQYFLGKGGAAGAVGAAAGATFEAAVDYAFNPNQAESGAKAGNTFDVNGISPTLRQVFGNIPQDILRGDYKISAGQSQKFADQVLLNGAYNLRAAASSGYIPNFAAGSPLGDAINREMAAGLKPSQIRVTQDGRLKNSQNPRGLAVINTRDEPNGRVPNFVDEAKIRKNTFGRGDVQGPLIPQGQKPVEMTAAEAAQALGKVQGSSAKLSIGMDKMLLAMSATMMATSTLEATLGKTDSAFGKAAIEAGKAASSMSQFASLGALIPGAGPAGAIAGAAIGLGMYGYQAATEPTRIAAEQRANVREQELNPQGDLQKQIDQTTKSLNFRAKVLEKAQKDANKYMFEYAKTGDSMAADLFEEAKDSIQEESEQIKKLQQALEKLYQIDIESEAARAKEAAKVKKELEDRVALSAQIGKINIAYAKGEASILTARAARYAVITENASSLTEVEKRRSENALKVADIEEKIQNVGKDTLYNLVKEVADKSKLATISEKELQSLQERFIQNEKSVNLDEEANKLGIEGAANLKLILQRSIENSEITKIKLKAEKDALETQLRAVEAGSLQATVIKNRIALLRAEYEIGQEIIDSRERDRVQQEEFDRGAELRTLKKQVAGKAFVSPEEQARLTILEEDLKFSDQKKKIEEESKTAQRKNFEDFKKQAMARVDGNNNITGTIQTQVIENIKNVQSIEDVTNALSKLTSTNEEDANSIKLVNSLVRLQIDLLKQRNAEAEGKKTRAERELQSPAETAKRTRDLLSGSVEAGVYDAFVEINKETAGFSETFGKNATLGFRDGLRDALGAAISQTDSLGAALQNVASNFLKSMQGMFINQAANATMVGLQGAFPSILPKFAKGGLVSGGSGYSDDVPALLTGGEFVMRKSAVQKYGVANLAKMNNGGIFLPGVRGGGNITGYDQLRAFANQTTTSGATDILRGGGSSVFINLEDQSARLSRFGLLNEDTINQEIRSAQEQGLNIIAEREAYRTQQRKAFQKQLVGTVASAALSYGVGKLIPKRIPQTLTPGQQKYFQQIPNAVDSGYKGTTQFNFDEIQRIIDTRGSTGGFRGAYGGIVRRYATGGPTDDIPALLMSGEYIMNRGATSKYGRRMLEAMNQGRMSRFADGGEVGSVSENTSTDNGAKMMGDVNISINVTGQGTQTEAQGNTNQGGIDYKKMSERIKAVVLETINEEKRLGGALRSR